MHGVQCESKDLLESYELVGERLPTDVDMYEIIGRVIVLIAGYQTQLPNEANLKEIVEKFKSTKELGFVPIVMTDRPIRDDVARSWSNRIGGKIFGKCFDEYQEQMKGEFEVNVGTRGVDNKVHVGCSYKRSSPYWPARPVTYELLKDGISVQNITGKIEGKFIVDARNGVPSNFTCRAHFMYDFIVDKVSTFTPIGVNQSFAESSTVIGSVFHPVLMSNMFTIGILILAASLQIDAGIVTETVKCAIDVCRADHLECDYADFNSLDIFFFFDGMMNIMSMMEIDSIIKKFQSPNRYGVYFKMIQYNTTVSRTKCPLGVECYAFGFDEAYKRIAESLPINKASYRSVGRVAIHFIPNKAHYNGSTNYQSYYSSKYDLQFLDINQHALENQVADEAINFVVAQIPKAAFKTCPSRRSENKIYCCWQDKTAWRKLRKKN
uniref:Uncharacterized protein n=1 Tax=Romanomermis culicivorax TaxID=13658 RepID=A0A915L712_ROMCU